MKNKVLSFGNNKSERLCWVRIEVPTCNLYIICVYVPHRARVKPCQADTLKELDAAIKKAPKGDCIIVLGDFNEELPPKIAKHTGAHTLNQQGSKNAEAILNVMRNHELYAANTKFRKRKSPATYTQVESKAEHNCPQGSSSLYVGRKVRTKWKGKYYEGEVV